MGTSKFHHPLRYPSLDPNTEPGDALEQISITVSALERNRRALEDWLNAYVLSIDDALNDAPLPEGTTTITIGGKAVGGHPTIVVAASDSDATWASQYADYTCDGTDDQVEIQSALDDLPTNGGEVLLLNGTYNITGEIVLPKGTYIRGQSRLHTILKQPDGTDLAGDMLTTLDQNNGPLRISDMTLDGNKANNASSTMSGIAFTNNANNSDWPNSVFERLLVQNMPYYGFTVTDTAIVSGRGPRTTYRDIHVQDCGRNGFRIFGDLTGSEDWVVMDSVTVEDVGQTSPYYAGMILEHGRYMMRNVSVVRSGSTGISTTYANLHMTDCWVDDAGYLTGTGSGVSYTYGQGDFTMQGGGLVNCGGNGFNTMLTSGDLRFHNVRFEDNGAVALELPISADIIITGCLFINNGEEAITVNYAGTYTIVGNHFHGNSKSSSGTYPHIDVSGSPANQQGRGLIVGNDFSPSDNSTTYAPYLIQIANDADFGADHPYIRSNHGHDYLTARLNDPGGRSDEDMSLDGPAIVSHATAHHTSGGGDEIDGDQLDIDWNPTYYTPATTPTEVSDLDHLTAHLYGIDQQFNTQASASNITSDRIAGSTYSTVQHMQDIFHSSGHTSGGTISNGGTNLVDVAAGTGLIRATDDPTDALLWFDWSAATGLSVPADSVRWIGVEYNAGSPQAVARASDNFDYNTDFPLGIVVNEGGVLHILNAPHAVGDHASQMILRAVQTTPLARDDLTGGLILGETGTRNVTLSAGALWRGLSRFAISALDTSAAGSFETYYRDGVGGWTNTTGVTQWPNTQYDDGSGVLQTMTNNRFADLWWYVDVDGTVSMVYGQEEFVSLAAAEAAASPPSGLPNRLQYESILIAQTIFQKSDATWQENLSSWTAVFSSGGAVADHGNLTGLADDDHTQYVLVDGTRAFSGNVDMGANAITNVGNVDGVDVSAHASRHITSGADEIDGDKLDIDWTPTNYTPTTSPAEADSLDNLTAHLAGIDTLLGTGIDHGGLGGLADDDHTQYSLVDGTRAFSGQVTVSSGGADITGQVDVTGNILPGADLTYNLGSSTLTYDSVYAANIRDEGGNLVWDTSGNMSVAGTIGSTGNQTVTATAPAHVLVETDAANQTWSIISVGGQFRVRDVTGGTYPVYVDATASNGTLHVTTAGVDITGTLDVTGSDITLTNTGSVENIVATTTAGSQVAGHRMNTPAGDWGIYVGSSTHGTISGDLGFYDYDGTTYRMILRDDGSVEIAGALDVSGQIKASDGTVAAPSLTFSSESATGIYRNASGDVRVALQGTQYLQLTTAKLQVGTSVGSPNLTTAAGTAGAPAYSFVSDLTTGFYRYGAQAIGVSTGGLVRWYFDSLGRLISDASTGSTLLVADGSVGAPGISFSAAGQQDVGFYRIGADNIGMSLGGSKIWDFRADSTYFISYGAGASGAILYLLHESPSPAASDVVGAVNFTGLDSGLSGALYAEIQGTILDPTDLSEDGQLSFYGLTAGTRTNWGYWNGTGLNVTGTLNVTPASGNNTFTSPAGDSWPVLLRDSGANLLGGLYETSGGIAQLWLYDSDHAQALIVSGAGSISSSGQDLVLASSTGTIDVQDNTTITGILTVTDDLVLNEGGGDWRFSGFGTSLYLEPDTADGYFYVRSLGDVVKFYVHSTTGDVGSKGTIYTNTIDDDSGGTVTINANASVSGTLSVNTIAPVSGTTVTVSDDFVVEEASPQIEWSDTDGNDWRILVNGGNMVVDPLDGNGNWVIRNTALSSIFTVDTANDTVTVHTGTLIVGTPPTYGPITNVTTDRSFNANSANTAELADVLGTLIADLQAIGLLG